MNALFLVALAHAAAPGPGLVAPGPAHLGLRAVGEALRDGDVTRVYGTGTLSGEGVAGVGLPWQLEVEVSAGYRRRSGTLATEGGAAGGGSTWMWYAPVSAVVHGTLPAGAVTMFAGAGPSMVLWAEQPGAAASDRYQGTKPGAVMEMGVRAPLGRPLHDVREMPPEPHSLEGVLTVGYRWSAQRHGDECLGASPCGIDLSAPRVSFGVQARF